MTPAGPPPDVPATGPAPGPAPGPVPESAAGASAETPAEAQIGTSAGRGDGAAVEARAAELWPKRHHLTAAERAEIEGMPDPYRAVFVANELRRSGRRTEALLVASTALPAAPDPSSWRSHLYRVQGAILADLRLVDQAVESNTKAQDQARAVDDLVSLAVTIQDLAIYPHQADGDHRDRLLREARALAVEAGSDETVVIIDFNLAWWALERGGDPGPINEALADIEERARAHWPDLAAEARAGRVRTAARAGDLATARELVSVLPDEAGVDDEETRTAVACARAWVLADDGRVDEATETLERWLGVVSEEQRILLLSTLTEVLGHAGRYADAWRASRDLVDLTRANAQSLGASQARALEVWYRTQLAEQATRREQARADELEAALARLSEAHEQIREMSQRDLLTGLHNRGYLLEAGARAMAEASPQTPVVVVLADIDGFKAINDTYGHRAGDAVLAGLADVLRDVLDDGDLVARYGGEEFVVIRPAGVRPGRTLRADLCVVADRCRSLAFPDGEGRGPAGMTMSSGLVAATGGDLETALHDADLRMYEAKRAGGDRLVGDDA